MIPNKLNLQSSLRVSMALVAMAVACVSMAQDIRTTVNGELVNFPDVQPMMVNNHVMVPVRGVFEHMNATLDWVESTRTITAMHKGDTIKLQLNYKDALINGKPIPIDTPAIMVGGRVLVPLRFLGEAMNSSVEWLGDTRTVEIKTAPNYIPPAVNLGYSVMNLDSGTVIPFKFNQELGSKTSYNGQAFKATLDVGDVGNYQGLPKGTILEGHVEIAKPKSGDTPGVLGLAFDRIRLPDGQKIALYGVLSGLDSDSIDNQDGKLVAKPSAKNDNLKYVGIGAGGGALVALITKGNLLTNSLIGAALGLLAQQADTSKKANDVVTEKDAAFGVRLTRTLAYRVPTPNK